MADDLRNVLERLRHALVSKPQWPGASASVTVALSDLRKVVDALAATDWQPIETAPKDGTEVLAWFGPVVGIKSAKFTEPSGWDHEAWCVDDEKHGPFAVRRYCEPYPTHWMPLPDPPNLSTPTPDA